MSTILSHNWLWVTLAALAGLLITAWMMLRKVRTEQLTARTVSTGVAAAGAAGVAGAAALGAAALTLTARPLATKVLT